MDYMGEAKAALGIRYLLKYANKPNPIYLEVIKESRDEVKLWCLLTLFNNNMDGLWENVPNFVLEKVFLDLTPERIYHSLSKLGLKEQFKKIRDKLAHKSFRFQDGYIYIGDDEETYFNLNWFSDLVLSTVANCRGELKKGMSDIVNLSFVPKNKDDTMDFKEAWDLGYILFCQVKLMSSNASLMASYLNNPNIPSEKYTFDLIFLNVQREIGKFSLSLTKEVQDVWRQFKDYLQKIQNDFGNFISLEILDKEKLNINLNSDGFEALSYEGKLQYLINKIRLKDIYSGNAIFVNAILKVLDGDGCDVDDIYILRDLKDYLLKVYANILFAGVYVYADSDGDLKKYLALNFSFDAHFVHAKNIYKDYIKAIKRSYEEVCLYKGPEEYKNYLLGLIRNYTNLLDEVLKEEDDKRLFWNIRTAIVHNQIEFLENKVRMYITGRDIHLKHYQKKKQTWVDKEFKNKRVIWEMEIDKDEFIRMMDKLYELANIPIQTNISRLVRKKEKIQGK